MAHMRPSRTQSGLLGYFEYDRKPLEGLLSPQDAIENRLNHKYGGIGSIGEKAMMNQERKMAP